MRTLLLGLISLTTVTACLDAGYPDDDGEDTELATDGKADGWMSNTPQGTFSVTSAATGEITKLTLGADRKFRRETKRSSGSPKVETGGYKFTGSGASRYIRFLKPDGTLIDRYGFEIHGRQLQVRLVGEDDWQDLMANDNFGGVDSAYAGTFSAYGQGTQPDGSIFELMLHDTGRFYMTIEGINACNANGHSCPSSWSDGLTGSTNIYGTWAPKSGGVTLTPRNDATGAEGWKIELAMSISGDHADITGRDGSMQLKGSMDVRARFNAAHSVKNSALKGTWKVAKVPGDADYTVSVWGSALVINGAKHKITFDPTTNEMCEISPNVNNAPDCGIFQVAGDPSGGAKGLIYAASGTEFTALKIETKTTTKMTLRSGEDTLFTLTKE